MKKVYATFLFMAMASLGFSQYYYVPHLSPGQNPGNLNTDDEYPSGSGLPAGWATVLGGSNSSVTWSTAMNIPFTFNFNGSAVTQYKVSSNGVVTFDVASTVVPASTNSALPAASIPDKSVMVWGIESPGANDMVMSKTFGPAGSQQHWIFFSSYAKGNAWTYWSIVLEEGTDNIYIVDQRHSGPVSGLTLGIQVNSTTAASVAGSPNVAAKAASDPTSADNAYYEFVQGTQPQYDLTVSGETVDDNVILNTAPFNITGELTNYGTATVTSLDLNYTVNGGSAVTASLTGVSNLGTYANYNFSHPNAWTPASTGNYTIEVWASNINGNPDENTANDKLSFMVNVVDTFVNRQTLLEVFTSSTCGPCAPGNANMDQNVVPNITDYTIVKYQQNFPGAGDPYNTPASVNRRGWYNINSIPRMEIDGEWDQNAQSFTTSIFNGFQNVPAFIGFTFNEASYSGNNVTIDFDVNSYVNFPSENYRVQTVIVENKTTQNVATNGETEFHYVMMEMLPNESGENIPQLAKGGNYNFQRGTDMTSTNVEEMGDLTLVVWVENASSKKILNSAWMPIGSKVGLDENSVANNILSIYPNPATDMATLSFTSDANEKVSIKVHSVTGQLISESDLGVMADGTHNYQLNTANLNAGVYLVSLEIGNEQSSQRLTIIK